MAVIKDVAKLAGVSIGTVSKFFNHPESLRPDTYQKVAVAVASLDYRPSAIARSMRTGRTNIVAILVPEISNPFYAEAYSLLSAKLTETSFIPLLITTDGNPVLTDMEKLSLMLSHADAAILYLLDNRLNAQLISFFKELSMPCLVISQRPEQADYTILIEETEGAYSAAQHLLAIDRKRIGFIGGPQDDLMTHDKYQGFLQAIQEEGLEPSCIKHCPSFSPDEAYRAVAEIHAQLGEKDFPNALFCANDSLSLGGLKYLSKQGYRVPDRVAIVGFDDLPLCRLSQPELSSIALPLAQIAVHASSMLVAAEHQRRNASPQIPIPPVVLSTSLVVRASSRVRA